MSKEETESNVAQKPCEVDLFSMFPEGTRIFIDGNSVTFENMTPELLDVAAALNPEDPEIKKRLKGCRQNDGC